MANELNVGDKIVLLRDESQKGTVRFIGTTEFATGEWIGVELNEPNGKNNGSVKGVEYFKCEDNCDDDFAKDSQLSSNGEILENKINDSNNNTSLSTETTNQDSQTTENNNSVQQNPVSMNNELKEQIQPISEEIKLNEPTSQQKEKSFESPIPAIEQPTQSTKELPKIIEQKNSIEEKTTSILEDISSPIKTEKKVENIVEKILENIDNTQNISLTSDETKEEPEKKSDDENVQLNEESTQLNSQILNPVIGVNPSQVAISPLDVEFLESIEKNAQDCAHNFVKLSGVLRNSLQKTSSLSLQYMETFKTSVDNTSESVIQSTADMNKLITKCQELNQDLKPVETLAAQISDIKKSLDYFEILVARLTK